MKFSENSHRREVDRRNILHVRMDESTANVDGRSTGKPAASFEAVDGHVFA